jgi:hypothetical protein
VHAKSQNKVVLLSHMLLTFCSLVGTLQLRRMGESTMALTTLDTVFVFVVFG